MNPEERMTEQHESQERPPHKDGSSQFHFDPGTQMPYEWPRGKVRGSRAGARAAQIIALMLLAFLVGLVVHMVRWRWG